MAKKQIVTELKLTPAIEGDKQQIQSLYDACRGIPQGSPPPVFRDAETAAATQTDAETSDAATPPLFHDAETSDAATPRLFHVAETSDAEAAATQTDAEAIELAMAISASIQSTAEHRPPPLPNMHHFFAWGDFFGIDSPPPLIRAAASSDAETAAATQTDAEAIELAMAISASIQSTAEDRPPPLPNMHQFSNAWGNFFGSAGWGSSSRPAHLEASSSGWTWGVPGSGASSNATQHPQTQGRIPSIFQSSNRIPASCSSVPSAPPIPVGDDLDESLIHYPPIHSNPVDLSIPAVEDGVSKASDKGNGGSSSLCVICCEAPAECACVPCGHVAGCMDCLKEIKANKGACPICRSKIDQVLKIYAV